MIKIRNKLKLVLLVSFHLLLIYPYAGHCFTLITPEEAAQPDAPMIRTRGFKLTTKEDDGPQIKI
jgi:hypothetical protein